MAALPYLNIAGPSGGTTNMGGTKQWVGMAPFSYFTAISNPTATPTALGDLIKITTAHTLASGKVMHKIYCTLNKGNFKANSAGETDGMCSEIMGEIFIPNDEPETIGLACQAQNDRTLWWFPMANGRVFQIGSEDYFAQTKFDFDSAQIGTGVKGLKITVKTWLPYPLQYTPALVFS